MKKLGIISLTISSLLLLLSFRYSISERKDTEIIWDQWGVPHIYADNEEDLFFAQGWAQMHLHGNLILEIYGRARGKAAEYWGEEHLQEDILIHTFGFPELARQWTATQDPAQKRIITSFVDGMNAYAETHSDVFEAENRVVLPVQYDDVLLRDLFVAWIKWIGRSELNQIQQHSEQGSNAYAIAPSRSASGHAMLVQNPHTPWYGEYLSIEMHLNTPTENVYGSIGLGVPGIFIGFNESLGWAITVNTIDNVDIYELELVGDGYLLDGKPCAFAKSTKSLKINDEGGGFTEKEIEILQAAHGPVINKGDEKAYAIRLPVSERPNARLQSWRMAQASNFDAFEEALKMAQFPYLNILYADKDGTIFYLFNGWIPVRKSGGWDYWNRIIPGGKSEDIWTSIHPYEDLPKVKTPPQGWLQNSNDPPWSCTFPMVLDADEFPPYFAPQRMDFRNQRAVRMMDEDESITFEELIEYKLSTRMEMADRLLDDLFEAVDTYGSDLATEAKTVLASWDRQAESSSVGTFLFMDWAYRMGLHPWDGNKFTKPWSEDNPRTTPDGLADPEEAVKVLEQVATKIKQHYDSLTVPYGEILRLKYNNIDLPGNGAAGFVGAFRVTFPAGPELEDFYVAGGDSYVGIIEFADSIKAKVLLSYGNSTQEGSPHYGDQLKLFSEKKLRDANFYREDVLKNMERVVVLEEGKFVSKKQ